MKFTAWAVMIALLLMAGKSLIFTADTNQGPVLKPKGPNIVRIKIKKRKTRNGPIIITNEKAKAKTD